VRQPVVLCSPSSLIFRPMMSKMSHYKRRKSSDFAYQWGLYSMAKNQQQRLRSLIEQRYRHPDLQKQVLDEVLKAGTADKIISGELTLPSEHDAARHFSGFAEQEKARHWSQAARQGGGVHNTEDEARARLRMNELLTYEDEPEQGDELKVDDLSTTQSQGGR
jgi:hypothetical protein